MFAVLNSGVIVYESSKPERIIRFLGKDSSLASSLIVEIFTPKDFRRKYVDRTPSAPTKAKAKAG
jgi:hypothetical protein